MTTTEKKTMTIPKDPEKAFVEGMECGYCDGYRDGLQDGWSKGFDCGYEEAWRQYRER